MTSLSLPTIPIPPLINHLFSHFPLTTYPSPSSSLPPIPTLWLLGPPTLPSSRSSSSSPANALLESLDPACREAQALARFAGLVRREGISVKWCKGEQGAVGERLPNLHLEDGTLLGREETLEWLGERVGVEMGRGKEKGTEEEKEKETGVEDAGEGMRLAYESLVDTTLAPAVLAALYLSPLPTLSVTPHVPLPVLSSLANYFTKFDEKKEMIDLVKKLRGGRTPVREVLDLEEVEREGVETIADLEVRFRDSEKRDKEHIWFAASRTPTRLDAKIYALCSIVLEIPYSKENPMRAKLEKCRELMEFVKRNKPVGGVVVR